MADSFIYPACRLMSGDAVRLAEAQRRFYAQPVDVQMLTDAKEVFQPVWLPANFPFT